ncbi:MAG: hypothetical protein AAFX94_18180, partial [Myxococcota bacterium]
ELGLLGDAVVLAGCGEITNEDLVFLAAVPDSEELELIVEDEQVQAVAGVAQQAQLGEVSELYLALSEAAEQVNVQVEFVLEFVDDLGRVGPPSAREADRRIWEGPLSDTTLGRLEISRRSGSDGTPTYTFCLHGILRDAPRSGDPVCVNDRAVTDGSNGWRAVLFGDFSPRSSLEGARTGTGNITLDFEAARPINLTEPGDEGRVTYDYDIEEGGEARELTLFVTPPESPLPEKDTFRWSYALDDDNDVSLFIEFDDNAEDTDPSVQELLQIDSCWNLNGPGLADFTISMGDIPATSTLSGRECWDVNRLRTFQQFNVDESTFSAGDASSCPVSCGS